LEIWFLFSFCGRVVFAAQLFPAVDKHTSLATDGTLSSHDLESYPTNAIISLI
jgi:hypothetical protein